MTSPLAESYHPREEQFNAYSHAVGAVLAVIAGVLMVIKAVISRLASGLDYGYMQAAWYYCSQVQRYITFPEPSSADSGTRNWTTQPFIISLQVLIRLFKYCIAYH